jgi:hypothetical protein
MCESVKLLPSVIPMCKLEEVSMDIKSRDITQHVIITWCKFVKLLVGGFQRRIYAEHYVGNLLREGWKGLKVYVEIN